MAVLVYGGVPVLGYCHCCGRPARVGRFELAGWKHVFYLCSLCLRDWARLIESQEVQTT